jgi:hypothetical protein
MSLKALKGRWNSNGRYLIKVKQFIVENLMALVTNVIA